MSAQVISLADYRRTRFRLVDCDAALAALDELCCLAADRVDRLPFGSPAWSGALESWVGLLKERSELGVIRAVVVEREAKRG